MGKTRMQRVQAQKRKEWGKLLKWIIYPPAVATALVVQAAKNSTQNSKKHEYNVKNNSESRVNNSTYGLSDKELRIFKNIIILNRQYVLEDVENIERLGSCNPFTGEMDRNSKHYGYKIYYNDGCSKFVTIPKEKIEE